MYLGVSQKSQHPAMFYAANGYHKPEHPNLA